MNTEDQPALPAVLCFGEILWDILPSGRFAGGAPLNVAYHLGQQGVATRLISAVGNDSLGDDLVAHVKSRGVDASGIARHATLPTGTVNAVLSATGEASYVFATPAAWDGIPASAATLAAAAQARGFVFGSLAQRAPANRVTLDRLLDALPRDAVRVFDVNLRPPFDDLDLVAQYAPRASWLKLNHEEAARLAGEAPKTGREEFHARRLAEKFGCATICITAGERGAGCWRKGAWRWEPGQAVQVADTVGAGDAFLAALLTAELSGRDIDTEGLRAACRLGEWVATQRGATPDYPSSRPN